MEPNTRDPSPDAPVGFEAFFGFIPPQTLRFDDSDGGGLKVKYARVKLPVTPSQTAPIAGVGDVADASRAAASA